MGINLHITLAGLNHRTAPVDIRERCDLSAHCAPDTWALRGDGRIKESLIISTCNRVEVLGIGSDNMEDALLSLWSKATGYPLKDIRSHLYIHQDLDAVEHIFEVASSLDSMVIGEPQILGQLKKAYRHAVESENAGSVLNHLMHHAFSVAKRVRTETAIASSAVSISYAAVELGKRIFGQMPGHKAMLLGAGEMAELAAMHLLQAGIDQILVANRTFSHAERLAEKFKGIPIKYDDLFDYLADVDILIASTGATQPVISRDQVSTALRKRKNKPIFFIDIAVPRDIDVAVNSLDNVYLYDIDDLKDIVEEHKLARNDEAVRGRKIIAEEVKKFQEWRDSLSIKPTILELVRRGEHIAEAELAKTLKHLGPVSPEMEKSLRLMAHAIAKKLEHDPIMYLKGNPLDEDDSAARIHLFRSIYNLDRTDKI